MSEVERYCVLATGDKHASLDKNLYNAPVEYYLRDSEKATDVRGYIERVQAIEAMCFGMTADNWTLAHFGLNGGGMIVTAEIDNEPVGAQYVAADCWEEKMGLRFWTTVVHPDARRVGIASVLTAVSTEATRSWAEFGGTICDTGSSMMGRNVKLDPLIVTANMHHTLGRKKVQLEWRTPDDPFKTLLEPSDKVELPQGLPVVESLTEYDLDGPPGLFNVSPEAQVWEDIANNPDKYGRYFKLVDYNYEVRLATLMPGA